MASARRTPPKHLKNSKSPERMPARPNDRLENERQRQMGIQGEDTYYQHRYGSKHHGEHSEHENVVQSPDNTKLFYDKLLPFAKKSHMKNKRFLRSGVMWLFALPVILFIIRNMTGGNKIAFMIAWIIGMFIISSALIIIAYQDEILQRNLDELQEYVPDGEKSHMDKLQLLTAEDIRAWNPPENVDNIIQEARAERAEFEQRMSEIKSSIHEVDSRINKFKNQENGNEPTFDDNKGGTENE